jgi:hypothetical protein
MCESRQIPIAQRGRRWRRRLQLSALSKAPLGLSLEYPTRLPDRLITDISSASNLARSGSSESSEEWLKRMAPAGL